jgi:hypothetical protein
MRSTYFIDAQNAKDDKTYYLSSIDIKYIIANAQFGETIIVFHN